jgi:hypothetical protein
MTIHSIPRSRTNGQDHTHDGESVETCPLCGSALTSARYRQAMARLERVEKERMAAQEAVLKAQFAEQQRQAAAETAAQVEKARREASKAAAAALTPKIAEAVAQAVQVERTKVYGEKLSLEQQLEDMKRKLQRKSAHDIGEPAEVDLHAALVAACPEDRVSRVAKGVRGPDVIVEVIHRGIVAGRIILDSKDHSRWSNRFTQKLRDDQIAANADFAILSSNVFPAGKQHIHVQDNVIVASPARVPVLVELLRRLVIQNHLLKLSIEARNEKADAIFDFITSAACSDLFERVAKLTSEMEVIDRAETVAHEKVWSKRADVNRAIRSAYEEFAGTVHRIIGTTPIGC